MTVVTDRSQGISSIYNGSLEIMVINSGPAYNTRTHILF